MRGAMVTSARYTPRNRAELVAFLIGLGDHRLASLSPDPPSCWGSTTRAHHQGRAFLRLSMAGPLPK
jgi:hypothetical protein